MARFGVDAATPIDAAALKGIGATFIVRYVSRFAPKAITKAEADTYRAAGIDLVVVFEDSATNALMGHQQGLSDAGFAKEQAEAAGMPAGRPIYFASDFDPALHGGPNAVDDYYDAVKQVLGDAAGIYGGITIVSRQMDRGLKWGWQTLAWSDGQRDARAQLYQSSINHQIGQFGVDFDSAEAADFGQWVLPEAPHHYDRYPTGPFPWGSLKLNEREIVEQYDSLRVHPHMHHDELYVLRTKCSFLAKRLVYLANKDYPNVPISYALAHRGEWTGWRFQELMKRVRGERVR